MAITRILLSRFDATDASHLVALIRHAGFRAVELLDGAFHPGLDGTSNSCGGGGCRQQAKTNAGLRPVGVVSAGSP